MEKNIYLDQFSINGVSIRVQDNEIWRNSYMNTIQGREQVEQDVPEPYKSAIMLLWGDEPTVDDQNNC